MKDNLEKSLSLVFGHEGGYSNRASDKGGPTKYGITIGTLGLAWGRKVTINEVKRLTLKQAATIYRSMYWNQIGGDLLPSGLDYMTFDFGINSGQTRAVKYLQKVLTANGSYRMAIDGHMGPGTLAAIRSYPGGVITLLHDFTEARMSFLRQIKGPQGFSPNGRGWTIRVTGKDPKGQWKDQPGVIGHAIEMYKASAETPVADFVPSEPVGVSLPKENVAAKPSASGVIDVLKSPELLTGIGTGITGLVGLASDMPAIQYAIAALLVGGGSLLGYLMLHRLKSEDRMN